MSLLLKITIRPKTLQTKSSIAHWIEEDTELPYVKNPSGDQSAKVIFIILFFSPPGGVRSIAISVSVCPIAYLKN